MKNKLLYLLLSILVGTAGLSAQESGSVSVNINLHPIHIITVNPSQKTVQIEYLTEADYQDGVISLQSGHLSVFSTGAFAVTARSVDPVLHADYTGREMPLSSLQIAALLPTGVAGNNVFLEKIDAAKEINLFSTKIIYSVETK